MRTLDELRTLRAGLQGQIKDVDGQIDARLAQTLVKCGGCGQGHEVGELDYIQTHWYTPPRGCSEGDYWNQGEGQWACPACSTRHRLFNRPDITALKHLFKSTVDEYKPR